MDKLTEMVFEYKKTKNQKLIKNIQRIISPIVKRLLWYWKFESFPKLIYSDLFDDAKSIILSEALKRFKFSKRKNCKFTSYYATALNFYLRRQYMAFFQNGKPIQKRWGRMHEFSLELFNIKDSETDSYSYLNLLHPKDTRKEIDKDLLIQAVDKLDLRQKKLIDLLYFTPTTKQKIMKKLKITNNQLNESHQEILNCLATQM